VDLEAGLVNEMGRETFLKRYIDTIKSLYDFILIDCPPAINIITINAYMAANSILIPTQQAEYSMEGIDGALELYSRIQGSGINSALGIEGLLFSMVGRKTKNRDKFKGEILEKYSGKIKIFDCEIPLTVNLSDADKYGISIFKHAPRSTPIESFVRLGKEITENE